MVRLFINVAPADNCNSGLSDYITGDYVKSKNGAKFEMAKIKTWERIAFLVNCG